jgi:Ku protein
MPRAIWTGAISFGLVTVPVKLYAAVQSKTVKFNQLDAEDHSRIAMKRTNAQTGEEVPYDRIVKGFEIAPDRYVVLEPSELDSLDPRKTKTIDIEGFVELSEVDPIYFDHPYYLVPGTGGAKPYRLLVDAMRESGRVGIAKVVIRSKQQLVALRPIGDVLAMSTMVFHDEVVPADSLDEVPGRRGRRGQPPRARDGQAARGVPHGAVGAREVPRHLPRGGPRPHRAQGGRRGDRDPAHARGALAGPRPHERAQGVPRRGAQDGRGSSGAARADEDGDGEVGRRERQRQRRRQARKAPAKKPAARKAPAKKPAAKK